MTVNDYTGVISAMITPCRETGVPDAPSIARLASRLVEEGCHGLFVLGSTGELPFLDEDQRRDVVAAAREGAGRDAKVYAGVSGTGVKQVIRYATNAAKDGADVAIAMAPFFLKVDQSGLHAYISAIADASPIPVGIYNHFRMPSVFDIDTVVQLAQHENIVAIKDSSPQAQCGIALARALADLPISMFQGREPFLHETFAAGAAGCVTALANVAPAWHRGLYDAVAQGDTQKAADLQERIFALSRIFRLDESGQSLAHFAYALRCVAQAQGWIEHTAGMVPGFAPSATFKQSVLTIWRDCSSQEN